MVKVSKDFSDNGQSMVTSIGKQVFGYLKVTTCIKDGLNFFFFFFEARAHFILQIVKDTELQIGDLRGRVVSPC